MIMIMLMGLFQINLIQFHHDVNTLDIQLQ